MYKDETEYNQDDEYPDTRGKNNDKSFNWEDFEKVLKDTYEKFPYLKDMRADPYEDIKDEPSRLPDFGRFEPNRRIPHRCPICSGKGIVSNGFYSSTENEWSTTSITPEQCRSCGGTGYIIL